MAVAHLARVLAWAKISKVKVPKQEELAKQFPTIRVPELDEPAKAIEPPSLPATETFDRYNWTLKGWESKPSVTYREGRAFLKSVEPGKKDETKARVNKGMTHRRVWEVIMAACSQVNPDAVMPSLMYQNIVREFGG